MSYLTGSTSVFPEGGVDQILEMYELPASQKANAKRYQELKTKETLTTAEQTELNALTIALQHFLITPPTFNKFADAVINMEKFFFSDVEPYIETKKLDFQAEVDKLTYRGEWQSGVQYFKKNVVTSGGEGYIAKLDNLNQAPPATAYWGKIANKGDKGDPSLNINFKGEYNSVSSYVSGDAVTFGGLWYYAKQNTLNNPPTNATYWELHTNQVVVGDTQPFDNRIIGWVDTTL